MGDPEDRGDSPTVVSRSGVGAAALPSEELIERLRAGKAALHARQAALSLREKVRVVMELQRIMLPLIAKQRPLRSWEKPWDLEP